MPATAIAHATDRRRSSRARRPRTPPARPRQRLELAGRRRVGVEVALGLADDAGLVGHVERHRRGRCRSRARSSRRRCRSRASASVAGIALAGRPEERQPCLLVPGEDVRLEPLARRRRLRRTPRRWRRPGPRSSAPRPPSAPPRRRSAPGTRRAPRTPAPSRRRASRPPASTPAPSRVTTVRRSSSSTTRPSSTSAMNSRVEFVPMSTTARRTAASGALTWCGIGLPSSPASRFSTASSAIRSRATRVAEPMCGATIRFGASSSGSSGGSGSGSVTSSAAPAISPSFSASAARPGRRSGRGRC